MKPIYRLPELQGNQAWYCETGCSHVEPKLHKNIYKQVWNPKGVLIEQHAEHYYTCGNGHLLGIWDEEQNDDVELPEEHYQEQENIFGFDQEDIDAARAIFEEQKEKFCENTNMLPKNIKAAITINLSDGRILKYTEDYLNEVEALLTADKIA